MEIEADDGTTGVGRFIGGAAGAQIVEDTWRALWKEGTRATSRSYLGPDVPRDAQLRLHARASMPWHETQITAAVYREMTHAIDATSSPVIWDQMFRSLHTGAVQCLSAVDLALWDLVGKLRNEPVYAAGREDEDDAARLLHDGAAGPGQAARVRGREDPVPLRAVRRRRGVCEERGVLPAVAGQGRPGLPAGARLLYGPDEALRHQTGTGARALRAQVARGVPAARRLRRL